MRRRSHSQKVIEEMAKGISATLRAAQGPPPPPPTRWQCFVMWFDINVALPLGWALGWVLRIIAAAIAARIGWELFQ